MPISHVYEICNAYEAGYGHGVNKDGKNGEYYSDKDLNEAYKIGYLAGLNSAKEEDSDESIF
jgi:hypothetical protein